MHRCLNLKLEYYVLSGTTIPDNLKPFKLENKYLIKKVIIRCDDIKKILI